MTIGAIRKLQAGCVATTVVAIIASLVLSTTTPSAAAPATAAASACSLPSPAVTPAATPAPVAKCVTAQPQSSLADGQFVKVTFAGFVAGTGVGFRQCIPSPKKVDTDCTPVNQQVVGVADDNGAGVTYLPVQAGSLLPAGSGKGTIACDAANPCVIAAMATTTDLTTAAFTPLAFARSRDDCPPFPNDGLLGDGSSSAYRAIYTWEFALCGAPANLGVDYTQTYSQHGRFSFQQGLADFAVTGPFPPETSTTASAPFRFAPVTASAVVIAYRIYDRRGSQITDLILTPDLIAQVFEGKLANFSANRAMGALNPGVLFPGRTVPFIRGEDSAQTYVFTSWLAAATPSVWTAGAQTTFPFPPSGVQGKTGSDAIGLAVADPTTVFQDQGNIGVMDSSTAAFYGLPTVRIKQADGSVVQASAEDETAVTHTIVDSKVNPDGTLAVDYTKPAATDYPMPMPTYMMVPTSTGGRLGRGCTNQASGDGCALQRGAQLAALLRYAVQNGQGTLPPGYAPLPPSLVGLSLDAAKAIPATPAPTPSPTAASTTSPSPVASPTAVPTATSPTSPPATPAPTQAIVRAPRAAPLGVVTLPPTLAPITLPTPSMTSCAVPGSTSSATGAVSGASTDTAATATATAPSATERSLPSAVTAPACPAAGAGTVTPTPTPPMPVTPMQLNLAQLADSTAVRYAMPLTVGLGAFGLLGGLALEVVVRRRPRLLGAMAAGGGGS